MQNTDNRTSVQNKLSDANIVDQIIRKWHHEETTYFYGSIINLHNNKIQQSLHPNGDTQFLYKPLNHILQFTPNLTDFGKMRLKFV